jgi:PQQ-like domain
MHNNKTASTRWSQCLPLSLSFSLSTCAGGGLIVLLFILGGCAQQMKAFELGFAALTGNQDSVALWETYPKYVKHVESFKGLKQADMHIATEGDHTDIMQFVAKDKLLVGWLKLEGLMSSTIAPKHRSLILYDLSQNGKVVWEYEREELMETYGRYRLIAAEDVIVLEKSHEDKLQWIGLDIKTGKKLWERTLIPPTHVTHRFNEVFFSHLSNNQLNIEKLDIKTGKSVWLNTDMNITKPDPASVLQSSWNASGITYVYANFVISINTTTGKALWLKKLKNIKKATDVVVDKNHILVYDANRIEKYSQKNGKLAWSKKLKKFNIDVITSDKKYVFAFSTSDKNTKIIALKSGNGKKLWSKTIKDKMRSMPVSEENLSFTTTKGFYVLRSNNGKQLIHSKFDNAFAMHSELTGYKDSKINLLPDNIVLKKYNYIISRERNGVMAINKKSGKIRWKQSVFEYDNKSNKLYFDNKLALYLMTLNINTPSEDHKAESSANPSSKNTYTVEPRNYFDSAMQQYVKSKKEPIKLKEEDSYHIQALSAGISLDEMGMRMARQEATATAATTAVNALYDYRLAQLDKRKNTGYINNSQLQMKLALNAHLNSLSPNFYTKPFAVLDIRGTTVVNLKTGKRHDFVTSPQLDISYQSIIDTYVISPDEKYFVSIGSGMDPKKMTSYNRRGRSLPKYALLIYKLNDTSFTKNSPMMDRGNYNNYWGWNVSDLYINTTEPKVNEKCRTMYSKPESEYKRFLRKASSAPGCWFEAFIASAGSANRGVSDFLIKEGFDINTDTDKDGYTPLERFFSKSCASCLKIFLYRYYPNPDIKIKQFGEHVTANEYFENKPNYQICFFDHCKKETKKQKNVFSQYLVEWNKRQSK